MTNKEKANQIFAANPSQKKLFFTQDGKAFFDVEYADAHAQKFANRELEEFRIEDSEFGQQVAEIAEKKRLADEAAAKAAEEAQDNENPTIEALSFQELKDLAVSKGIDLTGLNSKAKIIEAIAALDNLEVTED